MGRNNEKNIQAHNDKLHKAQGKAKAKKTARVLLRKAILKKYNDSNVLEKPAKLLSLLS